MGRVERKIQRRVTASEFSALGCPSYTALTRSPDNDGVVASYPLG